MTLRDVLKDCDYSEELKDKHLAMDISGIAYDSRKIKEGCLFVAIKGDKYDGHDFIKEVIQKRAASIVYEHNNMAQEAEFKTLHNEICSVKVKNSRKALACISNNFFGRPSEKLTLLGVTGTNGKTTTTYILKSVLDAWGKEVGLIGTIQHMIKDKVYPAVHTTPESPEFQGLLKDMLESGCAHVISEISSHALSKYRVDGSVFRAAMFTNLTRDHLDFHKTMENYFKAKVRLFKELLDSEGTAVINLDDPYGKRLISELRSSQGGLNSQIKILTYGLDPDADITATDIHSSFHGLRFTLMFQHKSHDISSLLTGTPNAYNIMCAVGAAISIGVPRQVIIEGLKKIERIRGRFERIDLGQDFLCIVDYAHTQDALERLILTARELLRQSAVSSQRPSVTSQRIITVFGCGGDRDRGKRQAMGEVATRLSDLVIITSDNPRSEEPLTIIKDIENGVVKKNYLIEPDRREAIKRAIMMAKRGDILLIAGKGHEDYQEIKGIRNRFSDREIAEEIISNKLNMHNAPCKI